MFCSKINYMEKITLKEYIENLNKKEELKEGKLLRFFLSKRLKRLIKRMEKTASKKQENFKFEKEIKSAKELQKDFEILETKIKNKKINKEEIKRESKKLFSKAKVLYNDSKQSGAIKGLVFKTFIFLFGIFLGIVAGEVYEEIKKYPTLINVVDADGPERLLDIENKVKNEFKTKQIPPPKNYGLFLDEFGRTFVGRKNR